MHVVQAIIYVVDSSDTERISTSAEEFHAILDEEELREALILVYANKQASCGWVKSKDARKCWLQFAKRSPAGMDDRQYWHLQLLQLLAFLPWGTRLDADFTVDAGCILIGLQCGSVCCVQNVHCVQWP